MATIANPLAGLFSSPSAPTSLIAPSIPAGTSNDNETDASGWLSGLGDLFTGVGTAASSIIKATNTPTPPNVGTGWIYNPATGGYYNAQGQQLTATGTITSQPGVSGLFSNPIILLFIAVVGFFLLRKKAA